MKYKFKYDCIFRKKVISLGIDIGSNLTMYDKCSNLFIEIGILFWTFGFEIYKDFEPSEIAWYDNNTMSLKKNTSLKVSKY